jgi:nicotinate-nucleotide--dimethylbenzimidazole phosphoribosyltransferase
MKKSNNELQLKDVIKKIADVDSSVGEQTASYIDTLTKPRGSLGRLEELAVELAEITGDPFPRVSPPGVIVMAADHGIAAEGVSAFPQEVTAQMVGNFLQGGAAINVFARQIEAMFKIVDIGVAQDLDGQGLLKRKIRYGTANFLKANAMSREEAIQSILVGIEVAEQLIEDGAKCLIPGEMGIANTTSSSAILAILSGQDVSTLVGAGTGINEEQILHKQRVIQESLAQRKPNPADPIDILMKVGGLEIGGLAGVMLGAAAKRTPILVDGFISTIAALLASRLCPTAKDYMIVGHQSQEPGHQVALSLLGKKPLLDLGLRLGEGSGAAIAFPILESAVRMLGEMATFSSAGVSDKE